MSFLWNGPVNKDGKPYLGRAEFIYTPQDHGQFIYDAEFIRREREAQADIAAGRVTYYPDSESFIAALEARHVEP